MLKIIGTILLNDFQNYGGTAEFMQDAGGGFWIDYDKPLLITGSLASQGDNTFKANIHAIQSKFVSLGSIQSPSSSGYSPQEYFGFINELALAGSITYNALDNDLKRRYAHKSSQRTNLKSGKIFQSAKSFGNKSARVLGRSANVIGIRSILYDFSTGNANTSALVDAGLLIGGTVTVIGVVATPYVKRVGIAYGIGSLFGFDDYLDKTFDISNRINFIKSKH